MQISPASSPRLPYSLSVVRSLLVAIIVTAVATSVVVVVPICFFLSLLS